MARVEIQVERERERGWEYRVRVAYDDGSVLEHDVRLSWMDHDLWSGGRLAPSTVVEAVLRYAIDHGAPTPFPVSFDAGRARRWHPRIDREIRSGELDPQD